MINIKNSEHILKELKYKKSPGENNVFRSQKFHLSKTITWEEFDEFVQLCLKEDLFLKLTKNELNRNS